MVRLKLMRIDGTLTLPGDKSISHRSLLLASLTDGNCIIHNISTGKDVESTRYCLLSCSIESIKENSKVEISGGKLANPELPLDCGNSGTTVRLLTGLLAGQNIIAKFIGDNSLSKRPMGRIIQPLKKMGLNIEDHNEKLPIAINGSELKGIHFETPVASAQVKSCILLAGLGAEGKTSIKESILTRDHTEIMLKELGINIVQNGDIEIEPLSGPLTPFEMTVPGDPSTAAFFAAAAAILPNSSLTIRNISANPTRIGFFNALEKMGGEVIWDNIQFECGEKVGDVHINWAPLNGIEITAPMIPSLIDELPIIAVLAAHAEGPTMVSGAEELRVKECDRIHAICRNLTNMGGEVIEKKDGFIIYPGNTLHNTNISTYHDHRIAMAFTVAGLTTPSENTLDYPKCMEISFPQFTSTLNSICR
ncbi:MAG: 3-phosphoshikimate 1-carboxyvinyltransferase [Candidatus Marinimicrobia bacterium]|nr:3-phosphoshikimate 1-carboxyvinyltransferase [Candidatus Neomarinimicrobiota bacterium]